MRYRWVQLFAAVGVAFAACDSPIVLDVVTTAPASAGASAGSSAAGMPSAGEGGIAGEPAAQGGGAHGGEAGEPSSSIGGEGGSAPGKPWFADPLFVASYASVALPGAYIRQRDGEGWVEAVDVATEAGSASFEMIPGLLDPSCLSFRGPGGQGYFLRHGNSRVHYHLADDTPLFFGDSTFCLEPGLADPAGVSFRSANYPTRFLHLRNGNELWIDEYVDTPEFAAESTFLEEAALAEP